MNLFWSVVCILFGYSACQTAKDSKPKCSIYDSKCQKNFFQNVGITYAPTGIESIGVPVIDPMQLRPTTVDILGLWNLTFIEGVTEGISKCTVISYNTDMEKRIKSPNIVCDTITVRGRYQLVPAPVVKETCSLDLSAKGNITITFDKWYFRVDYPFKIVRHDDNQIYVEGVFEKAVYESSMDKVTIHADGIKLGKRDYSADANRWLNANWKLVMNSNIGKRIHDLGAKYYYEMYGLFFAKTPANQYYSDDFESLVEN